MSKVGVFLRACSVASGRQHSTSSAQAQTVPRQKKKEKKKDGDSFYKLHELKKEFSIYILL